MASYVITSPEGKKFKVSGSGTKEDALAYFQSNYSPSAPVEQKSTEQPPEQSWGDSIALGAKKRALGIAELGTNALAATGLAPESTKYAKELIGDVGKDYNKQGTGTGVKGAVGEFIGDPFGAAALPLATSFKGMLAAGGLMGATGATGDENSNLMTNAKNAGVGAAASGVGFGLGKGLERVARPVVNQLGNAGKSAVAKLEAAGVPLTAAQKTGSKALASLEAVFSTLPTTSGAQNRTYANQGKQFTKAVLKEAGINADDAGRGVISKAADDFGNEYRALTANNNMNIDNTLLQNVGDIYTEATSGRLGQDAANLVKSVAGDVYNSGGAISGDVYQKTRSLLTQKANSAKDSFDAGLMKRLRNELDSAFERSLPQAQKGVMADINKRYQAFKPIQKAMESSKTNVLQNSTIDPTTLYNQVNVGAPLSDIADAGAAMLRPTVPDSGTAQRLLWQNALTGAGVAGLGSDNGYLQAAGLALAAPKGAQLLYNSKIGQKYLTEGMSKPIQAGANAISRVFPAAAAQGASANIKPPQEQPRPAIQEPAPEQIQPEANVQTDILQRIAQAESGGNPNAENPNSSASGMYQFTNNTWNASVQRWGKELGVSLKDRNNPQAQEKMANKLLESNASYLEKKTGNKPSDGELYLAHFMGAPAAVKLMKSYGTKASAPQMFPAAAKANQSIFFNKSGKPRSVEEVYQVITSKVENG